MGVPAVLASTLTGSGGAILPDDTYVLSVAVGNKVLESAQAGALTVHLLRVFLCLCLLMYSKRIRVPIYIQFG